MNRAETDPAHVAMQVIDLMRKAAPAAQAECHVEVDALALTRFANSAIHQNVAEATPTVSLRVHADGRTGSGTTSLTTADALAALVDRTLAAARLSRVDAAWAGLAPPAPLASGGVVDEAVVNAAPSDRASLVRAFVDAAGGLVAAGFCQTRHITGAFVNSAGQLCEGATTEASFDGIACAATSDGLARLTGARLRDLDGAALGARAAAKARAGGAAVELPPGRYEVVLEPTAVLDVLTSLVMFGFDGKAVNENRSFLQPGQAQFDPSITIFDDPVGAGAVGLPFDTEGTPKRRTPIVTNGIVDGPAHNRRTAKVAGIESTGNATLFGRGFVTAVASNAVLAPGAGSEALTEVEGPMADSTVATLVAGVARGILVTDHWYTRVLDPRTLVMTGLTRNGVWLIEDGEVTRPLRNFRFTQSYPLALGPGAVLGIGSHAVLMPHKYGRITLRAPALRLASWNFTGGASG